MSKWMKYLAILRNGIINPTVTKYMKYTAIIITAWILAGIGMSGDMTKHINVCKMSQYVNLVGNNIWGKEKHKRMGQYK
jgi:hypothetical protein